MIFIFQLCICLLMGSLLFGVESEETHCFSRALELIKTFLHSNVAETIKIEGNTVIQLQTSNHRWQFDGMSFMQVDSTDSSKVITLKSPTGKICFVDNGCMLTWTYNNSNGEWFLVDRTYINGSGCS